MKFFIINLIIILGIQTANAAPATTPSTQKLVDIMDLNKYIQDTFSDDSISETLTTHIISLYDPIIPNDEITRNRIKTAIRNYYLQSDFKDTYEKHIFAVYSENYTEEETLAWVKFFSSPIGKSILNNKAFNHELSKAFEQLFNQNLVLSDSGQKKVSDLIYQFIED